jgi:hypothetical protein
MMREDKTAGASNDLAADTSVNPCDRRSHPRYNVDEDSKLLLVSHGLSLESHILDLSLEGCRLSTRDRYTAGMRTRVEVTFKVNGIAFRFVGVVQWTDGNHLVGIHFVEMISRRREQLAEVICEMDAVAAARAAKEAAEQGAQTLPEEQVESAGQELPEQQTRIEGEKEATQRERERAKELADWEARQWAEIQALEQRGKAVQADDELAPTSQASMKRDRRAQKRCRVDTAATILLVKVGSRLSGRIVDLSMNGCRIRIDERFPVGIYTRVETEFSLEGLPFRLAGVIQAIHDRHSVGIRFLDMSQRKREQVEQLIAEIAELEEKRAEPTVSGEGASGSES